jgi:hypothetical protein
VLDDGNVLIHVRRNGENITLPVANKYNPESSKKAAAFSLPWGLFKSFWNSCQ